MTRVWALYLFGVVAASCAGFFSPWWYLGFIPPAIGAIWAAYDLVDAGGDNGDAQGTPHGPR